MENRKKEVKKNINCTKRKQTQTHTQRENIMIVNVQCISHSTKFFYNIYFRILHLPMVGIK